MPRQTSLDKVTAALSEHGWEFTVTDVEVRVPDPDSDRVVRGYSGRVRYMPSKTVPGKRVVANNRIPKGSVSYGAFSFRMEFTADGTFVRESVSGDYPFHSKTPVGEVLALVDRQAPAEVKARQEKRTTEEQAFLEDERAAVAAAYEAAWETEQAALTALRNTLSGMGLSSLQVENVVTMAAANSGEVVDLRNAVAARIRAGRGHLPDRFSRGTYENGRPVAEEASV